MRYCPKCRGEYFDWAGIKYDVENWANVVGIKKQPLVANLEPQIEDIMP